MTQTQKFRPYLSPSDLLEILRCLKKESQNLSLIKNLEILSLKIDSGIISPSLTLAPTIESKLGLDTDSPKKPKTTIRYAAYLKWCEDPSKCTPLELERVHEYRFENDLMSQEEEKIYLESKGATP